MEKQKPIGIFDSGLGGLSIGRAVNSIIPREDLLYYADFEFSPYGPKSKDFIAARADCIVQFLVDKGCKLIVVACNTATVNSIDALRSRFSIPIVGVEPGLKPAALASERGVVGILATEQTLNSESFKQLKSGYSAQVKIKEMACPDFVSLVERLEHEGEGAIHAAERYIKPLLDAGCDQIVLGCTHFSFLAPVINNLIGTRAELVDTAAAVASQVQRVLSQHNIGSDAGVGSIEFLASGDSNDGARSIGALWGRDVSVAQAVR